MMDANGTEDWRVLCELASKEKDPEKLINLVMKINDVLEDLHQKSCYPLNAYSMAPLLSQPAQYDC